MHSKNFQKKVAFDNINSEHLKTLQIANYEALIKLAISYSDRLIMASENLPETILNEINESKKPQLNFLDSKKEEEFIEFYSKKF